MVEERINVKFSFLNLTPEQIRLMHRFCKLTDEMRDAKIYLVKTDDYILALNNESNRIVPAYKYYTGNSDACESMKLEDYPHVGMQVIDMLEMKEHDKYQPIYVIKDAGDRIQSK